jgi:hypothetical protein
MKPKEEEKKFKRLYVVEPSHDVSVLKSYTNNVIFMTTGNELVSELEQKIYENLEEFHPEEDAIISMGRTVACLLTGLLIGSLYPWQEITYGIYRGEELYEFVVFNKEKKEMEESLNE